MRCQDQIQVESKFIAVGNVVTPHRVTPRPTYVSNYLSIVPPAACTVPISHEGEFPVPEMAHISWQSQTIDQQLIEGDFANRFRQTIVTQCQASVANERILQSIVSAVKGGNLSMALLLFAGMESRQASEIGTIITKKMQDLQQRRRDVSTQISNLPNNGDGSKGLAPLQQQLNEIDGDMSIYQQILKDLLQDKHQAMELANSVSQGEHQTIMSIARR